MLHFIIAELSGFLKICKLIKWYGFAGSPLLSGSSSSCGEQRLLSPQCAAFSSQWLLVAGRGRSGCRLRWLWPWRSVLAARRPGCSGVWDLAGPGIELVSPALAGGWTPYHCATREALEPSFNTLQSSSKLWKMIHLFKNICCVSKSYCLSTKSFPRALI